VLRRRLNHYEREITSLTAALQAYGLFAAGGLGGGFGYAGIPNSVAVCLDTYSGTNPNYFATQAWTNGNIAQTSAYPINGTITDGRMYVRCNHSGGSHRQLHVRAWCAPHTSPPCCLFPMCMMQTFAWRYVRSSGIVNWTISGPGYSQMFTQFVGDITSPSILNSRYAYIGMSE
jgi:hypothetical protein